MTELRQQLMQVMRKASTDSRLPDEERTGAAESLRKLERLEQLGIRPTR